MNDIKVNRLAMLEIVKTNKEKHIAAFVEAVTDYKKLAIEISKKNLKIAKTGDLDKFPQIKYLPAKPTSYESSYTRAIRMLEMSVDEVIEVDENTFNQIVLDEWVWKQSFVTTNSTYKNSN